MPLSSPVSDPLARAATLQCWSGPVDPEPLGGGLTNTNFLVADRGRKYVVRIGEDIPVHGIGRANELAASRAAFLAGVSPEVVHAEPGALVLSFIEGKTFQPADVRDAKNLPALVRLVHAAHRGIPKFLRGPARIFWVFHAVRDYAHTLREAGSPYAPDLPDMLGQAEILQAATGPISIVFGHNDLLAGNILDDGQRLWLIDWDYGGFNSPLFDLGGLASNSELPPAAFETLLELYFDRPVTDDLRRRAKAMMAASLLREALWSMVSEIHSHLDFDYAAYTRENLARYKTAYAIFETMR